MPITHKIEAAGDKAKRYRLAVKILEDAGGWKMVKETSKGNLWAKRGKYGFGEPRTLSEAVAQVLRVDYGLT